MQPQGLRPPLHQFRKDPPRWCHSASKSREYVATHGLEAHNRTRPSTHLVGRILEQSGFAKEISWAQESKCCIGLLALGAPQNLDFALFNGVEEACRISLTVDEVAWTIIGTCKLLSLSRSESS